MNRKTVRSDSGASAFGNPPSADLRRPRDSRWSETAENHGSFASIFVDDLNPRGAAEKMIASRVALAAWRLQNRPTRSSLRLDDERDEQALYRGLHALARLRGWRQPRWGVATTTPCLARLGDLDRDEASEQGPIARPDGLAGDSSTTFGALWRDRLVLDPRISERSPIVKGTNVTVCHVVSLVVDGSSWDDILGDHPELSEADIRACLAYAVEEEESSLHY